MWFGVLHHVVGKHEWHDGQCSRGPPVETEVDKPVLEKVSKAMEALRKLVCDKRWFSDISAFWRTSIARCWRMPPRGMLLSEYIMKIQDNTRVSGQNQPWPNPLRCWVWKLWEEMCICIPLGNIPWTLKYMEHVKCLAWCLWWLSLLIFLVILLYYVQRILPFHFPCDL